MKGGWHWIGVAHTLALSLGLHRNIDYARLSIREGRLRRRIWWSCYIRDRTFALASNRPWRIRDEEFDTPMLTLDDFDIDESEARYSQNDHCSMCRADKEEEMRLAQLSIGLAELCIQVGDILSIHFSVLPEEDASPPTQPPDETGLTTTLFFPGLTSRNLTKYWRAIENSSHGLEPDLRPVSAARMDRMPSSSTKLLSTWSSFLWFRHCIVLFFVQPCLVVTSSSIVCYPSEEHITRLWKYLTCHETSTSLDWVGSILLQLHCSSFQQFSCS